MGRLPDVPTERITLATSCCGHAEAIRVYDNTPYMNTTGRRSTIYRYLRLLGLPTYSYYIRGASIIAYAENGATVLALEYVLPRYVVGIGDPRLLRELLDHLARLDAERGVKPSQVTIVTMSHACRAYSAVFTCSENKTYIIDKKTGEKHTRTTCKCTYRPAAGGEERAA